MMGIFGLYEEVGNYIVWIFKGLLFLFCLVVYKNIFFGISIMLGVWMLRVVVF